MQKSHTSNVSVVDEYDVDVALGKLKNKIISGNNGIPTFLV